MASDIVEPLKEQATEIGKEVGSTVKDSASSAGEQAKAALTDAASTVKDEAASAAQDVKGKASDATQESRRRRRSPGTAFPAPSRRLGREWPRDNRRRGHRGLQGARSRRADRHHAVRLEGRLVRTKEQFKSDNVTILAAGVAFYLLLALAPRWPRCSPSTGW